ncbi:hypothetical protein EV363DRAFT_1170886 [Boletus edulis]|nr:hypothetical protein EV363DRAFT_1170886 [Boletus edulis]
MLTRPPLHPHYPLFASKPLIRPVQLDHKVAQYSRLCFTCAKWISSPVTSDDHRVPR